MAGKKRRRRKFDIVAQNWNRGVPFFRLWEIESYFAAKNIQPLKVR
jgi:hypothetical protein